MTYMYFVEWDVKPKLNYSVTYSKIYFNLVPSIYTPDVIEIGRPFVEGLTAGTPPSSKTQKLGTDIKNPAPRRR